MSLERITGLASAGAVTAAHLHSDVPGSPAVASAHRATFTCAGTLRPRNAMTLASSYASGLPLSVWRNSDPAYVRHVAALGDRRWDLVYVDHWLVWEAASRIRGTRKILHLHNAEPELFRRAAAGLSGARRLLASLEYRRVVTFLRRIVAEVDELHLLSDADREALESVGVRHDVTRLFLPAVPCEPGGTCPGFEERAPTALFIGSLSWMPNSEGVRWYLGTAWRERKAARFLDVAGAGADPALSSLAAQTSAVRMHGFVDDLDPLYASARCLVAPLLSGSGIKIKIINALARGLPVVTTSVGTEGMPDRGGGGVFVADTPAEFAARVDALVTEPTTWTAASSAATAYVARYFSGNEFARWCRGLAPAAVRRAS